MTRGPDPFGGWGPLVSLLRLVRRDEFDVPPERTSRLWPLRHVTGLLLALAAVWMTWAHLRAGIWVDLDVYRLGGQAIVDGSPLYEQSIHGLPFTYPPFAAVLFMPLTLVGTSASRYVMVGLTFAAYLAVGTIVARRLRLSPQQAVPLVVLGLAAEPLCGRCSWGRSTPFSCLPSWWTLWCWTAAAECLGPGGWWASPPVSSSHLGCSSSSSSSVATGLPSDARPPASPSASPSVGCLHRRPPPAIGWPGASPTWASGGTPR